MLRLNVLRIKFNDVYKKSKTKFIKDDYLKISLTGSTPRKFYGNVKIYKLSKIDNANNLLL